jgi:predicted DNA-binding transcriptional regulator AlpA
MFPDAFAKDDLLTSEEASKQLGLKNKNTLGVWRTTKRYALPYIKVGRLVRYRQSDIEKFISRNVHGKTEYS